MQRAEGSAHDVADLRFRKMPLPLLHRLIEIVLHVFEDEEQFIVLADHLLQLHDLGMIQLLQRLRAVRGVKGRRGASEHAQRGEAARDNGAAAEAQQQR